MIQISPTNRQEEIPLAGSLPFSLSTIQPTPVGGVVSLPIHKGVRFILEGQAPLVLTLPGFQERKHGVVSYPEVRIIFTVFPIGHLFGFSG